MYLLPGTVADHEEPQYILAKSVVRQPLGCPMQLTPDTVLLNGVVHTVDDDFTTAEAIAWRGEEIVFVGDTEKARRLAGEDTRVVDLNGRTVVPGFTDSHLHPVYAGKNLEVAVAWTTIQQMLVAGEVIPAVIPSANFVDEAILEKVNDWDRAEVEAEAEAWVEENR